MSMGHETGHETGRLSLYLDGELRPEDAGAVEAHLGECAACRTDFEALRAIVADAAGLPDVAPSRDLWPAVRAGLRPRGPRTRVLPLRRSSTRPRPARRRIALSVPQLVAAAIALMILPAGGVWLALSGGAGDAAAVAEGTAPTGSAADAVAAGVSGAGSGGIVLASYEGVIGELEAEFERRRDLLDPGTILVVERNLALIDQAILEARAALESDPSSGFLHSHLASAMRRKAELLMQAARIGRTES